MSAPIRLLVLSAGLSTPSSTRMLADVLSRASADALESRGAQVEVRTVELRELAHDITDMMLTRFPSQRLADVISALTQADAVIAVTPIFNVGPSGLAKSFLDAVDRELWTGKPVLLGATAGTSRHSLAIDYAIRPTFGYLRSEVVPTAVFASSADFGATSPDEADEQPLAVRARRAGAELATMLLAGVGEAAESAIEHEDQGQAAGQGQGRQAPQAGQAGQDQAITGPAADGGDARTGSSLDPEFSDFVPMDRLLGGK
ncbi:NAD(P)H-dependent oxidoreductase [Brachybacterium sp. JHP9]|uniref:NAD(P)H-dependent oxidoreductase n=1 Tax=Brachybacterium equifaecis TaxID=2910770 RepID=A0ABT0QZP6_9MICO|nr:CE1759 family FMN reductase [Brachybacterium equifaecis]MCL6423134.1 NAD(P)H-dependent oxidoreductase [Brachybacterium equifaecis]